MEMEFVVKVAVSVLLAALGWVVAHYFTSKRDLANKRREVQTEYLIEAYRNIEKAIEPAEYNADWCVLVQTAFSEVQLFGSQKQIDLAHEFAELLLNQRKIDKGKLNLLLMELRSSLRAQLGLESAGSSIGYIRINESNNY